MAVRYAFFVPSSKNCSSTKCGNYVICYYTYSISVVVDEILGISELISEVLNLYLFFF